MNASTKIRNDFPERLSGSYAERLAFAHAAMLDSDPDHQRRLHELSERAATGDIEPDLTETELNQLLD